MQGLFLLWQDAVYLSLLLWDCPAFGGICLWHDFALARLPAGRHGNDDFGRVAFSVHARLLAQIFIKREDLHLAFADQFNGIGRDNQFNFPGN